MAEHTRVDVGPAPIRRHKRRMEVGATSTREVVIVDFIGGFGPLCSIVSHVYITNVSA